MISCLSYELKLKVERYSYTLDSMLGNIELEIEIEMREWTALYQVFWILTKSRGNKECKSAL